MITIVTTIALKGRALDFKSRLGLDTRGLASKLLEIRWESIRLVPIYEEHSSNFEWTECLPGVTAIDRLDYINTTLENRKKSIAADGFGDLFELRFCHLAIDGIHFHYKMDEFSGEWMGL